ncbi:hypothetical protein DFH09DRAFT_1169014, partial [Mycena vulgaris]
HVSFRLEWCIFAASHVAILFPTAYGEFSPRLMPLRCLTRRDSSFNRKMLVFASIDASSLPDPSGLFFQQMRNEAEQLVASVNPEAEINRAVQFVPQIYEVSDEEVPTDRDDNSSRKEV